MHWFHTPKQQATQTTITSSDHRGGLKASESHNVAHLQRNCHQVLQSSGSVLTNFLLIRLVLLQVQADGGSAARSA